MNKIDQAIEALYNKVMEKPNKILDIFNNFYGKERVDMQEFPSNTEFKDSIYNKSIGSIFIVANRDSELPKLKIDYTVLLKDIDYSLISNEDIDAIVDSINSAAFISNIFDNCTGFILVHFPKVIVTNEYNRSTIVKNLYIKVPINANGAESGLFTMNRSEYNVAELYSNYMHSHAHSIPFNNFQEFVYCCLGDGPLKHTQTELALNFNEDRWNLFCLELSKYVEVESVAGIPYHKLENINFSTSKYPYLGRLYHILTGVDVMEVYRNEVLRTAIKDFLYYYLDHNNLTFSFRNGVYSIGIPFTEYLINISNAFIEWVNNKSDLEPYKELLNKFVKGYILKGNELYENSNLNGTIIDVYKGYIGKKVCTFKGNSINLIITDINSNELSDNKVRLINPAFASCFLNKILLTLNYRYGRNREDPDTIIGKIKYKV